jgi:hypothetical protein
MAASAAILPTPPTFAEVYRDALHKWLGSPAMWLMVSVGFVPALLLALRVLDLGAAFAEDLPRAMEVMLVAGSACFTAALPLAPVVALAMALSFWVRTVRGARYA